MMAKKTSSKQRQIFVTPKEASERLGVTTQTLRNWARSGKIEKIKLPSGHLRYDVDGLIAAMKAPEPARPEPVLRPSPIIPAMPAAEHPSLSALAVLMQDPKMATQIRAMLQANVSAPEAVTHPEIPPMASKDALKSAIEAIAGQV